MALTALTEYSFKDTKLAKIPLSKIRENKESLRPVVDKTVEKYVNLVDSVKQRGVMQPILVREVKDPTSGEILFGLIDGLHRYNAAMDAGLTEIPANIGDLADADLLEAQIIANTHKIETQPGQYTKAIITIMGANPLMTKTELCNRLNKSVKWLDDRLGLLNLKEEYFKQADSGEIPLVNAYTLSKLDQSMQDDYADRAKTMSGVEFNPLVNEVLNKIKADKRAGTKAKGEQYVANSRMRRPGVIKDELAFFETKNWAASKVAQIVKDYANGDAMLAAKLTLDFVLHLDPPTQAEERAAWDADQKAKAEKKAAAAAEREAATTGAAPVEQVKIK